MSRITHRARTTEHKLLAMASAAVAGWLVCSPLVLGYPTEGRVRAFAADLFIGSVLLLLAVLRLVAWSGTAWASRVELAFGLLLVVLPVTLGYRLDPHLVHAGLNEVLTGLTLVVLSAVSLKASGPWSY
jgi:hypothetical protein